MTRIIFSLDECQKSKSGMSEKSVTHRTSYCKTCLLDLVFMMFKRIEAFLLRTGCVSVVAHLFIRKILHCVADNNLTDII